MTRSSLSLTTRHANGICIAAIEGKLTLSPELAKVSAEIGAVLKRNPSSGLILDLSQVDDIDSAGLGELVNLYRTASDQQCKVAVAGARQRIQDMFGITRLGEFFPCYSNDAEAEAALRRAL